MRTDHKTKAQATKLPEQTPADQELDRELEDSFPASDPPQQTRPGAYVGGPYRPERQVENQPEGQFEEKAGHRGR